jgi:N-acylneuraminate cytidylyltransferase
MILQDGFKSLISGEFKSCLPIVKFSYPIQRAFRISENGIVEYLWQENINKRSQDLEAVYHDAGQYYFCYIKDFLANKSLIVNRCKGIITDELLVQDIDNETDWQLAEIKYKIANKAN